MTTIPFFTCPETVIDEYIGDQIIIIATKPNDGFLLSLIARTQLTEVGEMVVGHAVVVALVGAEVGLEVGAANNGMGNKAQRDASISTAQ